MCANSSNSDLTGTYEWLYWDTNVNGSAYYNLAADKYLYPIIDGSHYYYRINDNINNIMAVDAYCEIDDHPSGYVFDAQDCYQKWSVPDLIVINCQDICVIDNDQTYSNGVYVWIHFDSVTASSGYILLQPPYSTRYLYVWQVTTNIYEWLIGADYIENVRASHCRQNWVNLGRIFDIENCTESGTGKWETYDVNKFVADSMVVKRCNYPATTSPTAPLPTIAPTTGSPTTNNPTPPPTNNPTVAPSTNSPTAAPSTNNPTTNAPVPSPTNNPTNAPSTDAPTTDAPSTNNPTTNNPTTDAPTTAFPSTSTHDLYSSLATSTTFSPSTILIANSKTQNTNNVTTTSEKTSTTKPNDETAGSNNIDTEWVIIVLMGIIILCLIIIVVLLLVLWKNKKRAHVTTSSNIISMTSNNKKINNNDNNKIMDITNDADNIHTTHTIISLSSNLEMNNVEDEKSTDSDLYFKGIGNEGEEIDDIDDIDDNLYDSSTMRRTRGITPSQGNMINNNETMSKKDEDQTILTMEGNV